MVGVEGGVIDLTIQEKKSEKKLMCYLSRRDSMISSSNDECQSDYTIESFRGVSTNVSTNSTPILSDKTLEL
jgi:hypothetical protein